MLLMDKVYIAARQLLGSIIVEFHSPFVISVISDHFNNKRDKYSKVPLEVPLLGGPPLRTLCSLLRGNGFARVARSIRMPGVKTRQKGCSVHFR
jgi:hypothetical protein